jgi:FkbM family methyltransferase
MRFLKKWRFLIVKLIYRGLFKLGFTDDYFVHIKDLNYFSKDFSMQSCQFMDQIACNILKFGWCEYESPMGRIVSALSKNLELTFIDIGANTGFYSLVASASGAKNVVAYEPVPSIFKILQSNIAISQLKIESHQEAIADSPGHMTMYMPKSEGNYIETSASLNADFRNEHSETVEIKVRSLDELSTQFLNDGALVDVNFLLKIDVESYELPVVSGGKKFFKDIQPIVMLELLQGNRDRDAIYELIRGYGYVVFALSANSIKKINALNVSSSSDNYLFVPEKKLDLVVDILSLKVGFFIVD